MACRLTNATREIIAERVIRATFDAREKALKAAGVDFADQAYRLCIGSHFRTIAGSLPREWFYHSRDMIVARRIEQGNSSIYIHDLETVAVMLGADRWRNKAFEMSVSQPFPDSAVSSQACVFVSGADGDVLLAAHTALEKTAEALKKEKASLTERINGLLHSCRTVQRLMEVAPELKPYLPADAFEERAPLPAPVVGTLITDLMKSGLQLSTAEA